MAAARDSGLYSAIWRWHFYAALFVIPFILVFAATGGIYLFKPQIEGRLYQDLSNVSPGLQITSPDTQVRSALARFPGGHPQSYTPPADSGRSAWVRVMMAQGSVQSVAVNPHTGQVLGSVDEGRKPLQIIRELHGKLMLGKTGQAIQELAASWAMVLVLTGLYLWWPRSGSILLGTWFNWAGRIFWRDLHAVTGFWISGLLVFLIVTGLPWSVVSGEMIHTLAAKLGKGMPDTGVGWDGGGSRSVKSNLSTQDWVVTHAQQLAGAGVSPAPQSLTPLPLRRVVQIARQTPGLQAPFEIRLPVDSQGVYSLVTAHGGMPEATAYIHLDQYTGQVVRDVRWRDFGPLAQAIGIGVAMHEGRYFGWPNQLLGLIACVGLIVSAVAGLVMWWQRRPSGSLGAPIVPDDFRLGPALTAIILCFALLMPLMGASLVLIVTGEWLVQRYLFRQAARVS